MALNVQLDDLRARCRQEADMESDTFITDAEIDGHINRAARRLYQMIVAAGYKAPYLTTATMTGASPYTLPTDLLHISRVYINSQSSSGVQLDVEPMPTTYLRTGLRESDEARDVLIEYIPRLTSLSGDTDTFDGVDGWDDWIVLSVAIRMRMKDNNETAEYRLERDAVERSIMESAWMYDGENQTLTVGRSAAVSGYSYSRSGASLRLYKGRV